MKKLALILSSVFCFNANAQYTKLIDFADTANGKYPNGSVMQASDGMLYGMTSQGGAFGMGVLFQYNPITSTFTKKKDFSGVPFGSYPLGSLMQASDGMLYGMTTSGGTNNNGVLFQYDPATSIYMVEFEFGVTTNGSGPYGSLMQASDGMLYGMTASGGANNYWGVLFQYNPITNTYTKKIDFVCCLTGTNPYGTLLQASDGMLYGMTSQGGANNGVLFQYNPATSTYTKKLDFGGTTNGSYPIGDLIQASNGMLYGMTEWGGANMLGNLFQYNITTDTCTNLIDFAGTASGSSPRGSLIQASDSMLYGLTWQGGANNLGVLFQYNPTTNIFTNKLDFDGTTNGNYPFGSLMEASDGMLYGMTHEGGINGLGVLFKYGIGAAGINQVTGSNEQVTIYPNPTSDQFFIDANTTNKLNVDLYDVDGRHVFSVSVNGKSNINVTAFDQGIYTLTIKTVDRVINKKLVIVR